MIGPANTQHSEGTDIQATGGIRNRNPSTRATAGPRLRPLGHLDQHIILLFAYFISPSFGLPN